jgi:hypothetical protein
VGESGMIRNQMGKHNKSAMVAVYRTLCAIPPQKSVTVTTHRLCYAVLFCGLCTTFIAPSAQTERMMEKQ